MTEIDSYQVQVEEATAFLQPFFEDRPETGLILGTGLGALAREIEVAHEVEYEDIPYFPISTVETHHGKLIMGRLNGCPVVAMQGRFHLYEGYTPHQITLPVRVLALLGIRNLLISNAAGGMNPAYSRGDLMVLSDHINLQGQNPLSGPNVPEWGPRFPDMSRPYDLNLIEHVHANANRVSAKVHEGVYVAVEGPNLETRAEYRFLRKIGADAVGMSTVPEVLVARHMGMRVMAVSVITDECFPDTLEEISIDAVLTAAAKAEPSLTEIFKSVVAHLHT